MRPNIITGVRKGWLDFSREMQLLYLSNMNWLGNRQKPLWPQGSWHWPFAKRTIVAKEGAGGVWDILRNQPFFRAQPPTFLPNLQQPGHPVFNCGLNFSSCSLHTSVSYWFQEVPPPASQSQNQQRTSLDIPSLDSVPFSASSTAAATCSEYYKRLQKCPREVPNCKAHRMWILVLSVWTFR